MTKKASEKLTHLKRREIMYKRINLQLFADGGEGGSGAQSTTAGSGAGAQSGTYTYQQAEEIATARADRAEKAALKSYFQQQGMSEAEVQQAMVDYKANKEKNKPDVSAIEKERDEANKELSNLKNEKVLSGMKVKSEDLDYVMYKVNKLVPDKKDFKTAAEEWLKENPRYKEGGGYRVVTSTNTGSSVETGNGNEAINNMIRSSFGRK